MGSAHALDIRNTSASSVAGLGVGVVRSTHTLRRWGHEHEQRGYTQGSAQGAMQGPAWGTLEWAGCRRDQVA
eukprot:3730894-Alexandrium_andersonii.AAC.1